LTALRRPAFAATVGLGAPGGFRGARYRGLAKANAGLITIGELHAGRLIASARPLDYFPTTGL